MVRKLSYMVFVIAIVMMAGSMFHPVVAQETARTVAAAEPQVKDDLFAGTEKFAQGATDVSDVNLDPDLLGLVGNNKSNGLAQKMKFLVVHSYHYSKPGMYKTEDVEAYRQKLHMGNWSCFIHVADSKTGEATDICRRPSADNQGQEMAIITAKPLELTFVHIGGNATLADIKKLGGLNDSSPANKSAPTK